MFYKELSVLEALTVHPEAGLVLSSFHLGGCSHCSVSEYETLEQVCEGYGVPVEELLSALNNLLDESEGD